MQSVRIGSVALAAVVAATAIAGCASAEEKWVSSTNEKCEEMTKLFSGDGDLAWGDGIASDDVGKMKDRVAQIKNLRKHAQNDPPPEVNRRDLDAWLKQLVEYAKYTEQMQNDYSRPAPGSDLALAMSAAIVQRAAENTKAPAERLGLDECTKVDRWEKIG